VADIVISNAKNKQKLVRITTNFCWFLILI